MIITDSRVFTKDHIVPQIGLVLLWCHVANHMQDCLFLQHNPWIIVMLDHENRIILVMSFMSITFLAADKSLIHIARYFHYRKFIIFSSQHLLLPFLVKCKVVTLWLTHLLVLEVKFLDKIIVTWIIGNWVLTRYFQ